MTHTNRAHFLLESCTLVHYQISFHKCNSVAMQAETLTPLHLASLEGHLDQVVSLLGQGHDVNAVCHDARYRYWTPLHCASWHDHFEVVQVLVKHGANLDLQNARGFTALNAAAWKGYENIAKYLLHQGANPNLSSTEGYTPLMSACLKSGYEVVLLLLEKGADVNMVQDGGWTALHAAAEKCGVLEMLMMVKHGANLAEFGASALEVARSRNNFQMVGYLEGLLGAAAAPNHPVQ
ncbi:ankyrin-1-like [Zophobas morio]|uniref:ankyrin-1-like n=1 Tax=Zophobas morio TaxID=2755281 RepID=UPI003082A137